MWSDYGNFKVQLPALLACGNTRVEIKEVCNGDLQVVAL